MFLLRKQTNAATFYIGTINTSSFGLIFRHERDGLKFEVHQNSLEVISLKEDIQSLEQQLASQSKAVEWIKSEARDALQREALYRSELEDELKKVTKVKISNFLCVFFMFFFIPAQLLNEETKEVPIII